MVDALLNGELPTLVAKCFQLRQLILNGGSAWERPNGRENRLCSEWIRQRRPPGLMRLEKRPHLPIVKIANLRSGSFFQGNRSRFLNIRRLADGIDERVRLEAEHVAQMRNLLVWRFVGDAGRHHPRHKLLQE